MENSEDYVLVKGSYINNKNNKNNVTLTEGQMEIWRDFDVKYFKESGNHTIAFTGDERQNINLNYSSNSSYSYYTNSDSYINNLYLDNKSDEGIKLSQDLRVCGCISQNETNIDGRIVIYEDTSFSENQYVGDLYIYEKT